MNRSHLVLAAAVCFALLAVVDLMRGDDAAPEFVSALEPEAPVVAVTPPVAKVLPPVEASPPGEVAGASLGLAVSGRVTSAAGTRLPGVRVEARGGRAEPTVTDADGHYGLQVQLGAESTVLRFQADGYQEASVPLESPGAPGASATLDVRLVPQPGAVVSGTVRDERGAPIPGEVVQLRSSERRYRAVTGEGGRFAIPGVPPGPGYVTVQPGIGWRDYQRGVVVEADGISLDIELRSLVTSRLSGRLVDTEGNALPGVPLSVVSGQAMSRSFQARTDPRGEFALEGLPSGQLSFRAGTPVELTIRGVRLTPTRDEYVLLRADWGSEAMHGRVVDSEGMPILGAEVELSWSHVGDEGVGRSHRRVVTSAGGSFRFDRLGAGIHRLDVRAPGFDAIELDYEVSRQSAPLEVELTPTRSAG